MHGPARSHVGVDDVALLWERIWAHPAAAKLDLMPFGSMAVNSLRVEKGFTVKSDLDYAHWTEARIRYMRNSYIRDGCLCDGDLRDGGVRLLAVGCAVTFAGIRCGLDGRASSPSPHPSHTLQAGIEPFVAMARKAETSPFLGRDSPRPAERTRAFFQARALRLSALRLRVGRCSEARGVRAEGSAGTRSAC